jgi:hypothetical protein
VGETKALGFDAMVQTIAQLQDGDTIRLATLGYDARKYTVAGGRRKHVELLSPRGVWCGLDIQTATRRVLITYNPENGNPHTRQVVSIEVDTTPAPLSLPSADRVGRWWETEIDRLTGELAAAQAELARMDQHVTDHLVEKAKLRNERDHANEHAKRGEKAEKALRWVYDVARGVEPTGHLLDAPLDTAVATIVSAIAIGRPLANQKGS